MERKKLYILSEEEFKEIFKLNRNYKVPQSTLKQYSLYVKGSNLLYEELYNIDKMRPLVIDFQENKEKIVCYSQDKTTWQTFVSPLGTRMKLECSYIDKSKRPTPFWTYTKFNDKARNAASVAYNRFSNELLRIQSKYSSKYRIEMTWRNFFNKYGELHGPIWLDGCDFMCKLEIKNPQGLYEYIGDYDIKQSITNRYNVFNGPVLKPILKIIS